MLPGIKPTTTLELDNGCNASGVAHRTTFKIIGQHTSHPLTIVGGDFLQSKCLRGHMPYTQTVVLELSGRDTAVHRQTHRSMLVCTTLSRKPAITTSMVLALYDININRKFVCPRKCHLALLRYQYAVSGGCACPEGPTVLPLHRALSPAVPTFPRTQGRPTGRHP